MTEIAERREALDLVGTLTETSGIQVSAIGCLVIDPDLPFEQYEEVLRAAGAIKRALSFVIGDLINYGDGAYGERYAQAVEATGLAPETLMNYASVCRRVARSRRRAHYDYCPRAADEAKGCECPGVPFGVHAEVAALEPEVQIEWLDVVCARGWTRTELRDALRESRRLPEPPPDPTWTNDEERKKPPPLTEEVLEQAELRAERTLEERGTLPEGHPAWRSTAEAHAREVLALAPAAREALPAGLGSRLLQSTELGLLQAAARSLIEEAEAAEDGFARVPRARLDEIAELISED